MKIEINPDKLKNIQGDFEMVQSDFSEILLSTKNCDSLEIKDETAIFNLRAMRQVSNLLANIEREIVLAQNQKP
jgi:hypothetical protein